MATCCPSRAAGSHARARRVEAAGVEVGEHVVGDEADRDQVGVGGGPGQGEERPLELGHPPVRVDREKAGGEQRRCGRRRSSRRGDTARTRAE